MFSPRATFRWTVSRTSVQLFASWFVLGAALYAADVKVQSYVVDEIRFGRIDPPVVGQTDVTALAQASLEQRRPQPVECSGLVFAAGRLFLTSDRHEHVLFAAEMDVDGAAVKPVQPVAVVRNERDVLQDMESLTARPHPQGGWWFYALCSLSNDPHAMPTPKRRHMLRVRVDAQGEVDAATAVVIRADALRSQLTEVFNTFSIKPYHAYAGDFHGTDKNTYRWGNVEGMAFIPNSDRVLCGMRNPLIGEHALLFVVEGVDAAFDQRDGQSLRVIDVFRLDLGGRGVSDLCWDEQTRGYLIAAMRSNGPRVSVDQPYPSDDLDCALFWWSGNKADQPVMFAKVPDMKIEAICRLEGTSYIALGSDEGDVSEGRPQRQSMVTLMHFTGMRPRADKTP